MTKSFDAVGRHWHVALRCCGVAAALSLTAQPVIAGDGPQHYFTTGGFYQSPDSTRAVDSGYGAAYAYAGRLSASRWWELRLFAGTLETDVAGATDFYQAGAGLDLIQHLGKTAQGHPYLLAGAGAIGNDVVPDSEDGVTAYFDAGIGWRSAPWKGWGIRHRFELRGVYDTFASGQTDVLLGLTLEIPPSREKVVENVVERIVEVEKIVEREVIREASVAAATPALLPDADGDGVLDAQDQCPDTVAGARVEEDGCVRTAQVVVLPSIEFAYASAELTSNGQQQLDSVLRFLQDQSDIELDIWGHTDAQGEDEYNLRLSQRRAGAVRQHLVEMGVAAQRLTSAGYGESRPIAGNGTLEGRARNRRVELNIRARAGAARG